MKNKIKEIARGIWTLIQAVLALVLLAFIAFLVLFLAMSVLFGVLWCIDILFLGGVIFG